MSSNVTIRQRAQDATTPGFRLYRVVLAGERPDSAPIYLRLIGVQARLETMVIGGADVLLTLPHELAEELGLVPSFAGSVDASSRTGAGAARQRSRQQEAVPAERWVQQAVDVDSALDEAVRASAKHQNISKGETFRGFVEAGLAVVAKSPLKRPRDVPARLHRRTMNFPASLHAEISGLSVVNGLTKSEVLRQLAKLGLKALNR